MLPGSRTFMHESVHAEYLEKGKARALERVGGRSIQSRREQQGSQIAVS